MFTYRKLFSKILKLTSKHKYYFSIIVIFFCLLLGAQESKSGESPHILMLNSYHKNYLWSDNILAGIEAEFSRADLNVDLSVEYMDTKRHARKELFPLLAALYKKKFYNHYDLIIVSDNNALDFILDYREQLLPAIPIVFCGINNFDESMLKGHHNVTGIVEDFDLKSTINLALQMYPNTRNIAAFSGATKSAAANVKRLLKIKPEFKDVVTFIDLENLTAAEFKKALQQLPQNTILLRLSFLRDRAGLTFTPKESLKFINSNSSMPIFAAWDHSVTSGALGGIVVSGHLQGENAAKMALQILSGVPAADIPIIWKSPNVPMFNYVQMQRFKLSESILPEGSVIINKPSSLYAEHKETVWIILAVICTLAALVVVLIINIVRRRSIERDLQKAHYELESKVEERTLELSEINKNLHTEILERQQAEESLQESELSYRTLSENLPGIVYRVFARENNLIKFFNKMSQPLTGYNDEEFSGGEVCSLESLIHFEDRPEVQRRIRYAIENHTPFTLDYRFHHKDGSVKYFFENGRPIYGDDGNLLSIDGVILDITDWKLAEKNTEHLRKLNELILSAAGEGIYGLDTEGRTTFVNPAAARMICWEPEELIGVNQHNVLHHSKRDGSPYPHGECPIYTAFKDGKVHMIDNEVFWRKDGSSFPVEYISTPIKSNNGEIEGAVVVFRDITERKKAEKELKKAHDKLEQRIEERTEALKKTHEQLLHSEKLAAIGCLSASIAHEFNNPLQGVMNILKGVARRTTFGKEDTKLMTIAVDECNRMRDLIKSLQDFNRPTSGRKAQIDIHATLDSLLLLGKKEYTTRKIHIEKRYAEKMPLIKAVADQIKQIFLNLLNNAVYACEGGGTVTIETEVLGEIIIVRIHDTGVGITPEQKKHLFEPFFTTKPEVKGTGLGLSVSYGIIKEHGGEIKVESAPGRGSTFSIFLQIEGI